MLSIVIPSRNGQPYLQKTIDSILQKAEGEIEIIVVLDGLWPNPPLKYNPKVRVIHHGTETNNLGMRDSINAGMAIAKGEFVMKCDEHVLFDQGFDVKLAADCEDNWVVIPRRYRLDAENWKVIEDGRPPIDYMFIAYPYERPRDRTCGLHGAEDKQRYHDRKDILIDETMTSQGSCYFMKKKFWDEVIGPLDKEKYGTFTHESQEIGNKAWLSGGKNIVNKKTWYAHMHKGKRGKGYNFTSEQYRIHGRNNEKGRLFCVDYWMNNRWEQRKHDFEWLIDRFWPVPTWPENWKEEFYKDQKKERMIKNRLDFAQYLNDLGFKKGAEIGVHKGYYSEILCKTIPDLDLLCVDFWSGRTEPLYEEAKTRLDPYKTTIVKGRSMDIVKTIPDNSLDFVYIDADHSYEAVKDDIREWTKKVKIGGIVAGHDYYVFPSGRDGVIKAVDEFVNQNKIVLQTTEWDKSLQHRDDWQPNWFFYKLREY